MPVCVRVCRGTHMYRDEMSVDTSVSVHVCVCARRDGMRGRSALWHIHQLVWRWRGVSFVCDHVCTSTCTCMCRDGQLFVRMCVYQWTHVMGAAATL